MISDVELVARAIAADKYGLEHDSRFLDKIWPSYIDQAKVALGIVPGREVEIALRWPMVSRLGIVRWENL